MPFFSQDFETYRDHAYTVFSTGVSERILRAGHELGIFLPDRVGGHDYDRNASTSTSNQRGSSQSANEHGINQGNQWARYRSEVERAFQKRHGVAATSSNLRSVVGGGAQEEDDSSAAAAAASTSTSTSTSSSSSSALREDPATSAARRDRREQDRAERRGNLAAMREELNMLRWSPLHMAAYESNSPTSRIRALEEAIASLEGRR